MNKGLRLLHPIGILGGMGPEATIALMQRILAATLAEDDADHIPLIVNMNTGVPSRIRHLIDCDGIDPGPVIAQMAIGLEKAGAKALAMPCNTAHHYAHWISQSVTIPLLDMPRLTCARLAALVAPGSSIGILASPATNRIGLFRSYLEEVGMSAIFPEDENSVLASIRRIKKSGPNAADINMLDENSAQLADRGAAGILVGCTEFSLISAQIAAPVPFVDALDALVDEIIAFSGANRR